MPQYVIKSSGERELFDLVKFKRSLERVGASTDHIEKIAREVVALPDPLTTQMIYGFAFERLRDNFPPCAARYSLKYALYDLGPTGFIFEKFVGELFKAQGYSVQLDRIVQGVCVAHEIDIIIEKDGKRFIVECKFHNSAGLKTDVRDALDTKARFEDLSARWSRSIKPDLACDGVYLATNTQFTSKAITYGLCADVQLLGWSYPYKKGIADLIDTLGVTPLTSLTGLSGTQKRFLLDQDIILCRELLKRKDLLEKLDLSRSEQEKVYQECQELCTPQH